MPAKSRVEDRQISLKQRNKRYLKVIIVSKSGIERMDLVQLKSHQVSTRVHASDFIDCRLKVDLSMV